MAESLHTPEQRPLLRWDIRFSAEDPSDCVLEDDTATYRIRGAPSAALSAVLAEMNGRTSVNMITQRSGVGTSLVHSLMQSLHEHGVVVDAALCQGAFLPASDLFEFTRRLFPVWKDRLFGHPLWTGLATGSATRSQFIGWLLETYHFIEGANSRMPLAVAASADPRAARLIAGHYKEEYDHAHFFLKSLNSLGLDTETARSSRPLPGTRAVINYMRHCARRDHMEYAICSGFLESTGADRTKARDFYDRLKRHYSAGDSETVVSPMAAHTDLDEAYGHGDLFESVCGLSGDVTIDRASRILDAGYGLVETLELWSTDILRAYAAQEFHPRTGFERYR